MVRKGLDCWKELLMLTLETLDWIPPSSVVVADRLVELDMTLPSYGEIKDSKASVENVKSLAKPGTGKNPALSTSQQKSKASSADKNGQQPTKKPSSVGYEF